MGGSEEIAGERARWPNKRTAMLKTWVVGGLTFFYLFAGLIILMARGGDLVNLLAYGELNELGDFLAGALTPVAFIWLVYGYLVQGDELRLQREELRLQREELRLQRDELKGTRKTLGVQVEMMEEQAERDRDRDMLQGIRPRRR